MDEGKECCRLPPPTSLLGASDPMGHRLAPLRMVETAGKGGQGMETVVGTVAGRQVNGLEMLLDAGMSRERTELERD